jgi:hypothetical protein
LLLREEHPKGAGKKIADRRCGEEAGSKTASWGRSAQQRPVGRALHSNRQPTDEGCHRHYGIPSAISLTLKNISALTA